MPPLILGVHLLLSTGAALLALYLPARSVAARVFGGALLTAVLVGFALERRGDWAWDAMGISWPDAVFFTNLSLEGVAALSALMLRAASGSAARIRAGVLSLLAIGASGWSHAWLFAPVPPGLSGKADRTGYCRQTTEDSCSAAAAVMLLHHYGISATEAELATLCLTRAGHGTLPLGLFRGVTLATRGHGLRPHVLRLQGPAEFGKLGGPAIIRVGLLPGAPPQIVEKMAQLGWAPGLYHSVVVTAVEPSGNRLHVSDPSYGRERWPTKDLEYLWDGRALILVSSR